MYKNNKEHEWIMVIMVYLSLTVLNSMYIWRILWKCSDSFISNYFIDGSMTSITTAVYWELNMPDGKLKFILNWGYNSCLLRIKCFWLKIEIYYKSDLNKFPLKNLK